MDSKMLISYYSFMLLFIYTVKLMFMLYGLNLSQLKKNTVTKENNLTLNDNNWNMDGMVDKGTLAIK